MGGTVPQQGKILQVVSTAKTDTFSTTSATFTTVTGLTASITPSATSSKILIIAQISSALHNSADSFGHFKVTRGGTDIYLGDAGSSRIQGVYGGYTLGDNKSALLSHSVTFLDSPSTTSSTTYQVEARIGAGGTIYVNRSKQDGDDANHSRGASSITLMEVAA